jgi:hypothetical protein
VHQQQIRDTVGIGAAAFRQQQPAGDPTNGALPKSSAWAAFPGAVLKPAAIPAIAVRIKWFAIGLATHETTSEPS